MKDIELVRRRAQPSPVPIADIQKAAEAIAEHIRRDIATGKLKDGDSLPAEGELIRHFNVSRPTLRSAFRILESESLLTIVRGAQGGPRIRHPGAEVAARNFGLLLQLRDTRVGEFFRIRTVIEPAGAALMAERQPPEGVAVLESIVGQESSALTDTPRFADLSIRYYAAVTEHCGNNIIALFGDVLNVLFPKAVGYSLSAIAGPSDDPRLAFVLQDLRADHAHLLEIIKRGDAEEARRFWTDHLERLAGHGSELVPELESMPFAAFD